MRRARVLGAGLAASVLLTAGGAAFAQTVSIGAILPLTGASASVGEDQRRGAELAVEQVNAHGGVLGGKLKVIVEDSGGSAPTALSAASVPPVCAPFINTTRSTGEDVERQSMISRR